MQIVRTIVWVLLLTALLVFSYANWDPKVTVHIWSNLLVETRIPAIVIVSFLIGFVPMWLLYRTHRWQSGRRIDSLQATARNVAVASPAVATAPVTTVEDDRLQSPTIHSAPLTADDRRDPSFGPPPGL